MTTLPPTNHHPNQQTIREHKHHLDTTPGWHPWPTPIKPSTAYTYSTHIRQGRIFGAGYEATVRNGILYTRKI